MKSQNILSGAELKAALGDKKVVVTMTSWPARIKRCADTIASVLHQSFQPDKIYLNLSTAEFPNREEDLPAPLVSLFDEHRRGCVFNWVDGPNTRTFKKVFPILGRLSGDDIIIDVDDDILWPYDFVASRLSDFINTGQDSPISSNLHPSVGIGGLIISACSLFQKKMLYGWEELCKNVSVVGTYNDDRTYLHLFYLNGYRPVPCSKYCVNRDADIPVLDLTASDTDPDSSGRSHKVVRGRRYDDIAVPVIERLTKKPLAACFGIWRDREAVERDRESRQVVVTMTSWTRRIGNCYTVVASMLDQTVPPDILYLNLSTVEFPNRLDDLPSDLVSLFEDNSTICVFNWVDGENTKTFKKVFPILEYLQDDDIILCVDDDFIYPHDYIESRLRDFDACQRPLSGSATGSRLMYGVQQILGSCSLMQKKMLAHWDQLLNSNIVHTYNDDVCYSVLCYMNGYIPTPTPRYDVKYILRHCTFNDVESSNKNDVYLKGPQVLDVYTERLREIVGPSLAADTLCGYFNAKKEINVRYITNYGNLTLYEKWKEYHSGLLPHHDDYSVEEYGYGLDFIKNVFPGYLSDTTTDVLCYIDVDCFVFDKTELDDTIRRFYDGGAVTMGMPDGGVICHRSSNTKYPNLFFTLFNLDEIRKFYDGSRLTSDNIDNATIIHHVHRISATPYKRLEIAKRDGLVPFEPPYRGCQEPYYKFFAYLDDHGGHFEYLYAEDSPEVDGDGVTTTLFSVNGRPMAYHTWFAREYGVSHEQTDRIDRVIEAAERLKNQKKITNINTKTNTTYYGNC